MEFRHNLTKRNPVERKPELPATTIIPLIYMHHVISQEICRTLIQNLRSLKNDTLGDCKLIKACRRNRNLSDILVKNKI